MYLDFDWRVDGVDGEAVFVQVGGARLQWAAGFVTILCEHFVTDGVSVHSYERHHQAIPDVRGHAVLDFVEVFAWKIIKVYF